MQGVYPIVGPKLKTGPKPHLSDAEKLEKRREHERRRGDRSEYRRKYKEDNLALCNLRNREWMRKRRQLIAELQFLALPTILEEKLNDSLNSPNP
jgi:hypothetical protein